jgi:NADPH-dependent glutamate synthase beta subunit-like oxidoreductase
MMSNQKIDTIIYRQPTAKAPCIQACPAGIDIPRYIRLTADGKFSEALSVIREKIPFPSVCGRVCFAPCESACNATLISDPISIRALKRYVTEQVTTPKEFPPDKLTGKSVAIIGSGPAGLSTAYYLAKLGHTVVVFEALSEPGGMMRFGIPDYRLPKNILRDEIDKLEDVGVTIRTNIRIESADILLEDGYNAVFLSCGAHQGAKLGIDGEDNPEVIDAVSFMKEANSGKEIDLGDRVAIIGGGNTAVDAARTALRLGAREVTIIYRRSRAEMPASTDEIEVALAEGIKTLFLTMPSRIYIRERDIQLECIHTKLAATDATGRKRPEPIKDSVFSMSFDNIIVAIGQYPVVPETFDLPIGPAKTILADPATCATGRDGIFAGGDMVYGTSTIIKAIASGRQAAISIDKYLGGKGIIDENTAIDKENIMPAGFQPVGERFAPPSLPVAERLFNFKEVELKYEEETAIREAKRCLQCDLPIVVDLKKCTGCRTCELRCSFRWEGSFIPAKSRVTILRLVANKDHEFDISFSDECDYCGICAKYCPYGALTRGRKAA